MAAASLREQLTRERRMTASVRASTGDLRGRRARTAGGYGPQPRRRHGVSLQALVVCLQRHADQERPGRSVLLRGRTAVLAAGELAEQVVAALGARRVLLHDLAEERRDVVQVGVLGVPDVLAVVVPGLQ